MIKRLLSTHMDKCSINNCPHREICYHIKRKDTGTRCDSPDMNKKITNISKQADHIYESICNEKNIINYIKAQISNVKDLKFDKKKYNITKTMSYNTYQQYLPLFKKLINIMNIKQIDKFIEYHKCQITVYNITQIQSLHYNVQKLLLIKDQKTYEYALHILSKNFIQYNNIHFPIYQEWARKNPVKLMTLIDKWNNRINKTISLDSCLENMLINHKCVYMENYIDINYDGTYRKCPFEIEGKPITDDIDSMYNDIYKPKCIYYELFGEEKNGRNNNVGTK